MKNTNCSLKEIAYFWAGQLAKAQLHTVRAIKLAQFGETSEMNKIVKLLNTFTEFEQYKPWINFIQDVDKIINFIFVDRVSRLRQ